MKKGKIVFVLSCLFIITPLLSGSPNVKGFTGLFEIAYPFTLSKNMVGVSFGINNIDLKTADVDVNRFLVGLGWGIVDNLELNVNLSYNRVHMLEEGEVNFEYPFAERWQTGLGYASLGLKYNFLKNEDTGFGILGHVDFPLSDEEKGVTTAEPNYGIDLLFAHKLTPRTIFSMNAGYHLYKDPDSVDIGNIIKYAAGIEAGIGESFSFAAQLAGKVYGGSDLEQDNPLDLILGFKYQGKDNFGIGVAYKKNILFNDKSLGDSHGAIGSIWYWPEKKVIKCLVVEAVSVKGDELVKAGEVRDYQALISPESASRPVNYQWTCSENGIIQSGQGTPTVSVKWNKENSDAWVKVKASNECSEVTSKKAVKVIEPVLPPKEEYYFAFDSYELCEALKKDLDTAIEYLKYHPEVAIELQGHTCSIATEEYNLALGEHRAEAVKNYLIENGISADRIKTISYGELKPAYENDHESARKKNRRVYIPPKKDK